MSCFQLIGSERKLNEICHLRALKFNGYLASLLNIYWIGLWNCSGLFLTMYVLAFGAKIRFFFEGGAPFWPPQKNVVSQGKKSKEYFCTWPPIFIL